MTSILHKYFKIFLIFIIIEKNDLSLIPNSILIVSYHMIKVCHPPLILAGFLLLKYAANVLKFLKHANVSIILIYLRV